MFYVQHVHWQSWLSVCFVLSTFVDCVFRQRYKFVFLSICNADHCWDQWLLRNSPDIRNSTSTLHCGP